MKPLELTNIDTAETALNGKQVRLMEYQEVKSILKPLFVMVGLRQQHWPVDEEKDFIINFIVKNYGLKTGSEIILAFELAITGKLDLKETKCYDQFTCEYFSRIMEAYRQWLKIQLENKKTFKPEPPMLEYQKDLADEEWREWLVDIKKYNVSIIPVAAYEYLLKNGLEITTDEKKEYFEMAINYQMSNLTAGTPQHADFVRWKKTRPKDETYRVIADLSKKMIVKDHLNQ